MGSEADSGIVSISGRVDGIEFGVVEHSSVALLLLGGEIALGEVEDEREVLRGYVNVDVLESIGFAIGELELVLVDGEGLGELILAVGIEAGSECSEDLGITEQGPQVECMNIGAVMEGKSPGREERTVLSTIRERRGILLVQHQLSKTVVKIEGKHLLKIEIVKRLFAEWSLTGHRQQMRLVPLECGGIESTAALPDTNGNASDPAAYFSMEVSDDPHPPGR